MHLLGADAAIPHDLASVSDRAVVETMIMDRNPDVVFNCAAYNAVDRAETEPELAFSINGDGPRVLATACRRAGASLVHFSTNYVFDGRHDQPYVEADHPDPLSVYGRSKLAGEAAVVEAGGHVLMVRTAALYGGPNSFPMRILERARAGDQLRVVSDQLVNPTFARDLAALAVELAEKGTAGIVHAVADGCCGWDEFARAVLAEAGIGVEVTSVSSADYPQAARRPKNGCLASTRIAPFRGWREALHECLQAPPH